MSPIKPSGPFGLDPDVIAEIEKDWVRVSDLPGGPELKTVDISILNSSLKTTEVNGVAYPQERLQMLIQRSRALMGQPTNAVGAYGNSAATHQHTAGAIDPTDALMQK